MHLQGSLSTGTSQVPLRVCFNRQLGHDSSSEFGKIFLFFAAKLLYPPSVQLWGFL
jgi:hypothetical protein